MEVITTKYAKDNLNEYLYHSKVSSTKYINQLIKYTQTISIMPRIGKVVYNVKKHKIRQLIYLKHKILYTVYNHKIYIIGFIHTSRNFDIQKNLNLINFPKL